MEQIIRNQPRADKKKKLSFDSILGIPYYVFLVVFVIFPLLIMMLYAFTSNAQANIFNIRFSFENFGIFLTSDYVFKSLLESIWLAILSTLLCLAICYPLAFMVSRLKRRTQTILVLFLTASMWINSLILIHSLKNVFLLAGNLVVGFDKSFPANAIFLGHDYSIIIGMIFLYFPYMFLPIYTQMTKIDENLFEGAADLGANKFQTIFRVVVPLTLSSVFSSCLVVLLPATTTLVVPEILTSGNRKMIGNLIEFLYNESQFGQMAAVALVLTVSLLIIVGIMKLLNRYEEVLSND